MNLDERIQSLRKRSGLSQEQLAEAIGVSRQAVSRWETGAALPDAMNVLALSRLFGVTADYLLGGGSAPSPPPAQGKGRRRAAAAGALMLLAGLGWNLGIFIAGRFVNSGGQLISEFENGVKVTTRLEPLGYAGMLESFGLAPLTAAFWVLAAAGCALLLRSALKGRGKI